MKKLLMAAAGVAGAGLAVASGAGPLMVVACGFMGAGAVPVTNVIRKTFTKGAKYDRDDVFTVVAMGAGFGLLRTVAPEDIKEDPTSFVAATVGLVGFSNFIAVVATATNDTDVGVPNVTRHRP